MMVIIPSPFVKGGLSKEFWGVSKTNILNEIINTKIKKYPDGQT